MEKLAQAAADEKLPPVDAWQPTVEKDMGLRISRDGAWHYLGSPIARPSLVRLLSRVMKREGEDFFLVSPVEKLRIEVEDAPFIATLMQVSGKGKEQVLRFETNVGDATLAGPDHAMRFEIDPTSGEPSPYVHVRARLEALISRAVFYDLVELGVVEGDDFGVWSHGVFFPITKADEIDLA